jgi:hypothetical protein|tara:strand:+ start:424 stop:756 length:333 start_codon:yes stop_codon:yes gene_type:complete
MSEIEQIDVSIDVARKDVEKMNGLLRLIKNKDFQSLIDDGYFVNESSRLVILRADPSMQDEVSQRTINDGMTAIGHFRQYLNTVMQIGRMSEQGIKEDEETRQELLAEEL